MSQISEVLNSFDILNKAKELCEKKQQREAWELICRHLNFKNQKLHEFEFFKKFIDEAFIKESNAKDLPRLKIAILGGYTTSVVANAVRMALCKENLLAEIYEAPFDTFQQEVLDPLSGIHQFQPELILFAIGPQNIKEFPNVATSVGPMIDHQISEFTELCRKLHDEFKCPILIHNIAGMNYNFIGIAETSLEWSQNNYLISFNRVLSEQKPLYVHVLDLDGLAKRVGYDNWHDERFYYHAKFGFNPKFIKEYSNLFLGVFRALWGRAKKCLVLDLDNTLWGGVIGDDGIDGIQLGNISAEGEAYAAFCKYILELKKRGVILAVCSKNENVVAQQVFEKHPEMPLKRDDFAAFYCNWEEKPGNLKKIAKDLNIDLSTLVFVDDNPMECDLVRQSLPAVTVVELPEDPADFIRYLDGLHLFDRFELTKEDENRAQSYIAINKAKEMQSSAVDIESYLKELEMTAEIYQATPGDLPRLAQMELKTNQFNLTTRRYSEAKIHELMRDENIIVLVCRLSDKFTDHGLVASVILVQEKDILRIDSWLMSCRVFARTLEHFMMNYIIGLASKRDVKMIQGEFISTPSNHKFSNLYKEFGFIIFGGGSTGYWSLSLDKAKAKSKTFVKNNSLEMINQITVSHE